MSDGAKVPETTTLGPGDPSWRPRDVDPRTEADAQVARALQVVCDADGDDEEDKLRRDYTPEELDTLFFALSMAIVQLKKLPGGREAHDRAYRNAKNELSRRGRHDILARLDAEASGETEDAELAASYRGASRALDELGVPAFAPEGEPVSAGQPLNVEARIRWLVDRRLPARDRRVQRTVVVRQCDVTEAERAHAHPAGTPGMWEVIRWEDSEAVKIVKRTFGDDVDLSEGTVGHHFVETVELELTQLQQLGEKLVALAVQIHPWKEKP